MEVQLLGRRLGGLVGLVLTPKHRVGRQEQLLELPQGEHDLRRLLPVIVPPARTCALDQDL